MLFEKIKFEQAHFTIGTAFAFVSIYRSISWLVFSISMEPRDYYILLSTPVDIGYL